MKLYLISFVLLLIAVLQTEGLVRHFAAFRFAENVTTKVCQKIKLHAQEIDSIQIITGTRRHYGKIFKLGECVQK
jgi:hypothetical protein